MTSQERIKVLKACKWVDRIITGMPYFYALEIVYEHDVDYVLHGDDVVYNEQGESFYSKFQKIGRFKYDNEIVQTHFGHFLDRCQKKIAQW